MDVKWRWSKGPMMLCFCFDFVSVSLSVYPTNVFVPIRTANNWWMNRFLCWNSQICKGRVQINSTEKTTSINRFTRLFSGWLKELKFKTYNSPARSMELLPIKKLASGWAILNYRSSADVWVIQWIISEELKDLAEKITSLILWTETISLNCWISPTLPVNFSWLEIPIMESIWG